jgi:signal transduction histidine kinase
VRLVVGTALGCGGSAVVFGPLAILAQGLPLLDISVLPLLILPIPLAFAVSVQRDHLFDLDPIINRALVYGALTASVVGLNVLVVGLLGLLFQARGSFLLSLLATGLAAVLVQPLRTQLQRAVNHIMYGQRDEPAVVLARLGQRLEATLAPEAVLPAIVETVAVALKLPYGAITLWQHEEGTFVTAATYGCLAGRPLVLPLTNQGAVVGQLIVTPRSPGEPLTAADHRLLDQIAAHAGVAAHAVRLTADLQRSRERLVAAREEERRRLRRDLHDGLGPTLASLTLQLDAARALLAPSPEADALLLDMKEQTQTAVGDIRRLIDALRPPALDELGLVSALREYATGYNHASGLHVVIDAPASLLPLPAAVEVAAYRIALEALTNAARHAHARTCRICLRVRDGLCLEIADDGAGLPAEPRFGVGLASMRERAAELGGRCTITPRPEGGTRVAAWLPLQTKE